MATSNIILTLAVYCQLPLVIIWFHFIPLHAYFSQAQEFGESFNNIIPAAIMFNWECMHMII